MIVQCEKCLTKYNLDESAVSPQGSKVRCSLCRHVFTAHPPEEAPLGSAGNLPREDEFEETVALDSPPALPKEDGEAAIEEHDFDFDKLFEDSEEEEVEKSVPGEDLGDLSDMDETLSENPAVEPHSSNGTISETLAERLKERSQRHAESNESKGGGRSAWAAILIALLLLAAGAGAVVVWAPGLLPESLSMLKPAGNHQAADLGVRRLSFKAVTGSFVDSEKAGHLFVIRGTVVNDYPKPRSFILVKGSILDDKGQVIRSKEAYAGNSFPEETLKEKSAAEINQALNDRSGMTEKNVNVGPGASLSFMIVFDNLPDNLSEFTIEAVSSSPAA